MTYSDAHGITSDPVAERNVTVSLTTFGVRLRWTPYAIESIMEQTVQANRIVLWVDPSLALPSKWPVWLRRQCDRGLEVRATEDVGPATKLLPALKAFPDDIIITIDDDQMYDSQVIDRLLCAHRRHPSAVCSNWVEAIGLDKDGKPEMIKRSDWGPAEGERFDLVAKGVGGVLYAPGVLDEKVFDVPLMMKLSPTSDDLWFKAVELLKDTPVIATLAGRPWHRIMMENELYPLDMALRVGNVLHGGDNRQLKALFDYFNLYEKWPRGMK